MLCRLSYEASLEAGQVRVRTLVLLDEAKHPLVLNYVYYTCTL